MMMIMTMIKTNNVIVILIVNNLHHFEHRMLLASKEGRAEEANAIDQTLQPLHKRYSNPSIF